VVTLIVQRLARSGGRTATATLLLAGLAITSLVNALLGLALHTADDAELRNLTFWLLGSLGGAHPTHVAVAVPIILVPLGLALRLAAPLDALLLGEAEAAHLGVDVERLKRGAIALAAVMVGAAVAMSGMIGFVGLLVPHLVRLALGPGHRALLPRAALGGAALLVLADLVARTIVAPQELPIGVLTALVGAPFFLWLLLRQEGRLSP
jgi:iron complex transport system permease protein